jgi:hypothetical protein
MTTDPREEFIPRDLHAIQDLAARLEWAKRAALRSEQRSYDARLKEVNAALARAQRERPLRPEDRT